MTIYNRFSELILEKHAMYQNNIPLKAEVEHFLEELLALLFPHFGKHEKCKNLSEIQNELSTIERLLTDIVEPLVASRGLSGGQVVLDFFAKLPYVYTLLWKDAEAIFKGDPAAESLDEVISAYPGFYAIYAYRVAHIFYRAKVPVFPRLITEYAHIKTGVDIHPGAEIGPSFFIDHATGIVIGETTVIGSNVKIYQGVTLGALSVSKVLADKKRHPTIEDNVIIYSSATILGGETVIGHDSVIGGNVWLTQSVPPHSVVYNTSEIRIQSKMTTDHTLMFHI